MSSKIQTPYPLFSDIDGHPLDAGFIYIGEAGKNPEVYPIQVFWDEDLTIPAAQPIRTRNGYLSYYGRAGKLYVSGEKCSITVKNKRKSLIYTDLYADLAFTQSNFNEKLRSLTINVESIADLLLLDKWDGRTAYVKSYHASKNVGGGVFIYNASKAAVNDGVITFNGWVRQWNNLEIYPEYAGALEGTDCTVQLQKVLDFISPTKFDTSVATMNNSESKLVLVLPSTKLGYTITDTLWIGAGTKVKGSGKLSFKEEYAKISSRIVTDFSDPRKPALSTSNWKTDGVRVAFDEKTDGNMYDSGLISHTPDIELLGFNVSTKTGTRGFIGARIQNAPRSKIEISCFGFDYGLLMNASWTSKVDCMALSYKCGLLAEFDNNNCNFDGYYNSRTDQNPLALTNLINFFTSDTGTDTSLNDINKRFGFVSRYAYGASSQNLTCEGNNVNAAICNGDYSISVLYTEKAIDYGLVTFANPTGLIINSYVGSYDTSIFCSGVNSKVVVNSLKKDGTTKENVFKVLNQYNTILQAPLSLNAYKRGVTYLGDDGTLYVGSTGNDLNSGKINSEPLLTLNEAFKRITDRFIFGDKGIKNGSKTSRIVLMSEGSYTLDDVFSLTSNVEISSLSATAPTLIFNGHVILNDVNISITNCNFTKSSVEGAVENSAFWSSTGINSVSINGGNVNIGAGGIVYCDFNGSSNITLLLNNNATTGSSISQLVQGNFSDTSPHIVSVVRSRGTISSAITGRPDKGVSVPSSWQSKVIGL